MTSYPDTAELNQTEKVALSWSQGQNHECHEINVTVLLLPCFIADGVPYIPKYHWLSFTGSLKSNASGNMVLVSRNLFRLLKTAFLSIKIKPLPWGKKKKYQGTYF